MINAIYVSQIKWKPKHVVSWVRNNADDSFCTSAEEFFDELPLIPKVKYSQHSEMALKIKNVQPHTDDSVGSIERNCSVLFVLSCPYETHLQVGNCATRLSPGGIYLFNDAFMHSVVAEKPWLGIAVQAKASKGFDANFHKIT